MLNEYIDFESEVHFLERYEIEGVRNITELSRQVRTLLNFKTEMMKFRFRSNENPLISQKDSKFFNLKMKFESLALNFITLLRNIKDTAGTIEEGIQSLRFRAEKMTLKKLKENTEQVFVQIHYFSEKNLCNHPFFLKILVKLTQEACLVKKLLSAQFSLFFEELRKNYNNLETELDILLPKKVPNEKSMNEKQYNEELIS